MIRLAFILGFITCTLYLGSALMGGLVVKKLCKLVFTGTVLGLIVALLGGLL